MGAIFAPGGHLATLVDVFGCHNWVSGEGAHWHDTRDTKHHLQCILYHSP